MAPSPHESFSLTVIEALTAGVPVLVQRGVRRRRGSTASSRVPGCGSATTPSSRPCSSVLTTDEVPPGDHAAQRSALRRGQLHLAGDPGPLLRVPRSLHGRRRHCARRSDRRERRPVAVEVGLLRERLAPRRTERRGQVAERDHGHRHDLGRQAQQFAPARRRRGRAAWSGSSRGRARGRRAAGSAPPGRPRRPSPWRRSAGCRRTRRRAPGRPATPPMAPWSTSRRKAGERRCSSSALAPPSQSRAVSSPMAARSARRRARRRTRRAGCSPRSARGSPRSGCGPRWRRRRRRGGRTGRPAGCAPRRRSRAGVTAADGTDRRGR